MPALHQDMLPVLDRSCQEVEHGAYRLLKWKREIVAPANHEERSPDSRCEVNLVNFWSNGFLRETSACQNGGLKSMFNSEDDDSQNGSPAVSRVRNCV